MKNKKGFTLVELISVVAILALIIGIGSLMVISIRDNILKKDSDNTRLYIETKAVEYANKTGVTKVSVEDLIKEGFVKPDDETNIYDPLDNSILNCFVLSLKFTDGEFNVTDWEDYKDLTDATCMPYEKSRRYTIKYKADGGSWNKLTDDDNKTVWINKAKITLGLFSETGLMDDSAYNFSWYSNNGTKGSNSTLEINSKDGVVSAYYTVVVEKKRGAGEAPDASEDGFASTEVRIDNQIPRLISVDYDKSGWTNGTKKVTVNANDGIGSGVDKIYLVKGASDCTSSNMIPVNLMNKNTMDVDKGRYIVCIVDKAGNIASPSSASENSKFSFDISNIDTTKPSVSIKSNPASGDYATTVNLIGNATDSESGIVAYQFNTSSTVPTTGWISVTRTKSLTNQTNSAYGITASGNNKTYYFWVKDAAGNTNKASMYVDNVGTLKTYTLNTSENRSSAQISASTSLSNIKKIVSTSVDNGTVSCTLSGTTVSCTAKSGTLKTGYETGTCTESPSTKSASSSTSCNSYSCPYGTLSGSKCTGSSYTISTSDPHVYKCNGKTYDRTHTGSMNTSCGRTGYSRGTNSSGQSYWGCTTIPSSCSTKGATLTYGCKGICVWNGDFNATCTSSTTTYSCSSGYTRVGTTCYKCSTGTFNSSTKICSYSCQVSYTYYKYGITINYIV